MLDRFKMIRNVGRFADAKPGGRSFDTKTVIFASNGLGKSTLTSILRSLATGDPVHIAERRTLGPTGAQRVELVVKKDGGKHTAVFDGTRWNDVSIPLSIFDTRFIARNVFDGERLNEVQLASLHRVVLGERGAQLAADIEQLKLDVSGIDRMTRELSQLFEKSGYGAMPFEDFVALKSQANLDVVIAELERERRFATASGLGAATPLPRTPLDRVHDLYRNPQGEHEVAKSRIKAHVRRHWSREDRSWDFLQQGYLLSSPRGCAFCGQDLENVSELMDAYRLYFSDAYEDGASASRQAAENVLSWNVLSGLHRLKQHIEAWSSYLPDECEQFSARLNAHWTTVENAKKALDDACQRKINRFEYEVKPTIVEALVVAINSVDFEVEAHNDVIRAYQRKTRSRSADTVNRELSQALAARGRHTSPWREHAEKYEASRAERAAKVQRLNESIAELERYSEASFKRHQKAINTVLARVGTAFEVVEFRQTSDKRRADVVSCGFALQFFDQHRVELTGQAGKPQFHNTLSQADRNVLAFAFFLATIQADDNLQSRVIVVDDPISSLDYERRLATVDLLSTIANDDGKKPIQIIILTHDITFLAALRLDPRFVDSKFLELVADGRSPAGCEQSRIEDCDIAARLRPRELQILDEIVALSESTKTVPLGAHSKCRAALECAFKYKYYAELKDLIAAHASLGLFVKRLAELGLYTPQHAATFEALIPRLHQPTHAHSMEGAEPSAGDVKFLLRETCRLLRLV